MKFQLNKILLFLLLFVLVILGVEGAWYLYLNKSLSSEKIIKKQKLIKNKKKLSQPNLNSKKTLQAFNQCFLGENIDTLGFLIEGKLVKTDLKNNLLEISCGRNKIQLIIKDATKFLMADKNKTWQYDTVNNTKLHPVYNKVNKKQFFANFKKNDKIQINIYEKEDLYYINLISGIIS